MVVVLSQLNSKYPAWDQTGPLVDTKSPANFSSLASGGYDGTECRVAAEDFKGCFPCCPGVIGRMEGEGRCP